jgi:Arc/MetJ family transcription regulator
MQKYKQTIILSAREAALAMRTSIDIDDALIERAMRLTGLRTKRAMIERALAKLVDWRAREAMAEAFGRYPTDLDPEELDEAPASP